MLIAITVSAVLGLAAAGQGPVLARCRESSAAHRQAATRLAQLDERIERLRDPDPVADVVKELHGLLETECFRPAAEAARVPTPDTAVSLKEWWNHGGGAGWLASFLELPRLGLVKDLKPHVVVPADVRKTLDLDAHRDHPLASLLCSANDPACGAETRGWKLRADAYFDAYRALGRDLGGAADDQRRPPSVTDVSRACTAKAARVSAAQRYRQWRACIDADRPKRVALPLGEFKAPATGWLIVQGRRGHYGFCDTTRAYHLATGAAFLHESCSNLALKRGGDVDVDATNKARVERVMAGTVSVDGIREALWMMLLRGEAEEVQMTAEHYPLPAGVTPRLALPMPEDGSIHSGGWVTTGQTSLTWRWVPDAGAALIGELTWPDSSDAAESHAASLLAVSEEGFVEGCAAAPVPAPSALTSGKSTNLNDVSADAVSEIDREIQKAFERWRVLPPCRAGGR